MTDDTQGIAEHYARGDLGAAILAALRGAGIDPDKLSPADLVPGLANRNGLSSNGRISTSYPRACQGGSG